MDLTVKTSLDMPGEDFHRCFGAGLAHELKRLGSTHPLHINGRACRSSVAPFTDICPADTRVLLGRFQRATAEHVGKALLAARKAFPFWRELGWEQRIAFVRKLAELMGRHRFELAALLCLEAGKTRSEAMAEVADSIGLIQYYCQQMETHHGYRLALGRNGAEQSFDNLEPYGVWAVIAPFAAPLAASANMVTGAVLAGNTVVFKPSSQTPLVALRLYELFQQAGFPVGIVNYVTGPGHEVGHRLASHPHVDGLIFAGSRQNGLALYHQFNRDIPRPCIMEMGGNNPAIVMPTANVEDAAEGIFRSAFSFCGQSCSTCSRVYVHQKVGEELLQLLVEKVRGCRIGLPEDPETLMGPLISEKAVGCFHKAVRQGKKDGRLVWGGRVFTEPPLAHGHFVEPTIFAEVRKDSILCREESPVPVLAVTEVKSLEEAIVLANSSPYGLSAGIFTQVDAEQEQFFDQIEAGTAFCNHRIGATSGIRPGAQSLGGWKSSGAAGKNALGPYFVTQFMREQSRTVCW